MWAFIVWIVIGGLAGWLASVIMKAQDSLLVNIILGIVGGLLGGWVLGLLGFPPENMGLFASFLTAVFGACLLILLGRVLFRGRASV
jgi:uncharacterized membrane protein YeaQ/YmgE (transglycosylase-associated protein family)